MEQSVRSDSTPVSAGHDTTGRQDFDHGRDEAVATMLKAETNRGSAVAAAIRLHEEAYGQRLYAEAGHLADAAARAEQERDAFRRLLHTPLVSDADRLACAQAVIGRAAGGRGSECQGSDAFWRDYSLAVEGAPKPSAGAAKGSLSWLVAQYVASGEWSDLSAATRKQRHAVYRVVEEVSGAVPVQAIEPASILAGRDKRRDRPHAANNFIKAMRGLFGWAAAPVRRLVPIDPTVGISLLSGRNDEAGFHAWTEDEVARFEDHWSVGTRQRLAFDLLLYTGLRRGDAVRLGRAHVRNGVFTIRTEKTGIVVIAPILAPLATSIAASPVGAETFIATERGKPFTKESFGTWFGKA